LFARVLSLDGPRLASLELIPSGVHRNVPKTMSFVRVVGFVNLTEDSFSCRDLGIGRPLST
jgi:hypothetical protein